MTMSNMDMANYLIIFHHTQTDKLLEKRKVSLWALIPINLAS